MSVYTAGTSASEKSNASTASTVRPALVAEREKKKREQSAAKKALTAQNKADAIERLVRLLQRAAQTPKQRVPTRPSRAAKRRRIESKKATGRAKQLRRPPGLDA